MCNKWIHPEVKTKKCNKSMTCNSASALDVREHQHLKHICSSHVGGRHMFNRLDWVLQLRWLHFVWKKNSKMELLSSRESTMELGLCKAELMHLLHAKLNFWTWLYLRHNEESEWREAGHFGTTLSTVSMAAKYSVLVPNLRLASDHLAGSV